MPDPLSPPPGERRELAGNPVRLVAYGDDPLAYTAERLLDRFSPHLPVLDRVIVLLPDAQAAPRLRQHLMRLAQARGHEALLGLRIETLNSWAESLPIPAPPIVPAAEAELLLVEAIQEYPWLFENSDPWRLCDGLMELFSELTIHQSPLPRDLSGFIETLRKGYAVREQSPRHLGREAELVHTLWSAWHRQLEAEGKTDPRAAYLLQLQESLRIDRTTFFYLVGFHTFTHAETQWLQSLLVREQAELILHGSASSDGYHPDAPLHALLGRLGLVGEAAACRDPSTDCLDAVFAHGTAPLSVRARHLADRTTASPLREQLFVFEAEDSEQEARAVDIQVRRWLLEGRRQIGIVTEDRRLARRVRALLERAGVRLQDAAGWALSTSSAASVLERWLEAIEEDFAHQPLMDLLKSPFVLPDDAPDEFQLAVYRLEQDIILHENIGRGLNRYRQHLRYRQHRLQWTERSSELVNRLLNTLQAAATPLLPLVRAAAAAPGAYLEALQASLSTVGIAGAFQRDPAGLRILQQLDAMGSAVRGRSLRLTWEDFRTWLGRVLEKTNFRPHTENSPVQLLSLAQTPLCRFDGLIVAAVEREYLPGKPAVSPYFNDSVRRELGLPCWRDALAARLHDFRRLLQSAPQVLLTRRREAAGEEVVCSPWLEAITSFHRIAYGSELTDLGLAELVADDQCQVAATEPASLPAPEPPPRATVPPGQVPRALSVAAHQRLLNCPYQFFAADCLGLKPMDEIREALEKSDYGERVHRCLQAFHSQVEGLPPPFSQPIGEHNRQAAVAHLETIAHAQFARDLEDNFMHRGWLKRWLKLIPLYVDWEIARQQRWHVHKVEDSRAEQLQSGHELKGRLDRIDMDAAGRLAVLDYKTGRVPGTEEVLAGEAVQLASYAMLMPEVEQVEYLQLDGDKVRVTGDLSGEPLRELADGLRARLAGLLTAIEGGAELPAWGNDSICEYCDMGGICRRQAWPEPVAG